MPTVIKSKFASTSNCPVPKGTSCVLTLLKRPNHQIVQQQAIKEKEYILVLDKYQADDFATIYQFVVSTPG